MINQEGGKVFGGLGRQETGVCKGHRIKLRFDRVDHVAVTVTKARHRRTTRSVKVTLAVFVNQIDAVTSQTDWR